MRESGICYFRFKGEVKESQIYVEYRNFEKKEHKMDIKLTFSGEGEGLFLRIEVFLHIYKQLAQV